jgi:hypothetical protein
MPLRPALALFFAALSLGFTACGDDDDDGGGSQPQAFQVQVAEEGGETRVTAPESVQPGAVEIRFTNDGERDHTVQIIRVGDGHTAAEVKKAGDAWAEGQGELPDWIVFVGGVGSTKPGGTGTATVELPAGEYLAYDVEGAGETPYAEFTVEGDDGEALPEVPAEVEAVDYDFNVTALEAGSKPVLFTNTGEEPHHLAAAPLKQGKTEADVEEYINTEEGPSPIVESEAFDTAIVSGGESAIVDVRFESGEYALLCFIPDRKGGPPHAVKGMIAVAPVG